MSKQEQVVTTIHTTTTTTTATAGGGSLSFRMDYLKSLKGLMLFLAMFYSLISFIVLISGTNNFYLGGFYGFFLAASLVSFCFCVFMYFSLLINLRSKLPLPWNLVDIIVYFIFLALMLTASSLVLANGVRKASGSAGTLGFIVVQCFVILLFLAIQDYRFMRSMTTGGGATSNTPQGAGSMPGSNFDPAY